MPWLLWRYTCVELLKVMLLTTSVIVVVIAFGATIKPLVQNQIDPLDVGKYAFFASVPMLQFALPFSAGFAATIVMQLWVYEVLRRPEEVRSELQRGVACIAICGTQQR